MEFPYWLRSRKTGSQPCLSSTSKKKKIMKSTARGSLDNDPFESLPTEILQKILGYLPVVDRVRVERVCKRWKNVSTERVWRDVQVLYIISPELKATYDGFRDFLKNFGKFIMMNNNQLFIVGFYGLGIIKSLVFRAGRHVKKIIFVIDSDKTCTRSVLSIIAAHCHNIECIELDKVEKSAVRAFSKLLRHNKQLRSISCPDAENTIEKLPLRDWKSLVLRPYEGIESEDWNNRLTVLVENSPSVETLFISHFSPNLLAAISKCEQLKCLEFSSSFGELYDQMMNLSLLNRLTSLTMAISDHQVDSSIDLLRHCINLESLAFHPYPGIFPLEIIRAVLALPKLECLRVHGNSVNDEILIRLLKFKCLEFYSFSSSITNNGIFEMIMNSECLETLRIPSEIPSTTKLFERLVKNTRERRKVLKIAVPVHIHKEALNICKGSKIHII